MNPTPFASHCLDLLGRILAQRSIEAQFVEVVGSTETYWKASLPQIETELYVYLDGGGVMVGRKWTGFEWEDYRDRDKLCTAFALTVIKLLPAVATKTTPDVVS